MVGPTSHGCRKCVERKIRCDLTRPRCQKCTKSGRQCPGFEKKIRFVDITSATRRRDAQSSKSQNGVSSQGPPISGNETASWPLLSVPGNISTITQLPSLNSRQLQQRLSQPLCESLDSEGAQLMDLFLKDIKPEYFWTKTWFSVTYRSQVAPLVILACRALTMAHRALGHGGTLVSRCRQAYGQALHALRRAIAAPNEEDRLPLQNCILTLSMFEFYDAFLFRGVKRLVLQEFEGTGFSERNWIFHARAIEQIMKINGPHAYMFGGNPFIYIAMRDILIITAYKEQKPCFLDEPAWQTVTDKSGEDGPWFASDDAYHALFACHVKGPRLLQDAAIAVSQGRDLSGISTRALKLREAGIKALAQFIQILDEISKAPSEVLAATERPEIIYDFDGVEFGHVLVPRALCLHHSFVITVNQVLLQTGSSVSAQVLEAERRASALEICKCIPTLDKITVSIIGIFTLAYMPFFLERAASACPPEYKEWLHLKRERWSGTRSMHPSMCNVLESMQAT